jgi:sensor histidine kinase YesM
MSGPFAIRVGIISSIYAILYFAYSRFSLTGSLNMREIDGLAFGFILGYVNIAGFLGSWLLSRGKAFLDMHARAAYRFLAIGTAGTAWIVGLSAMGGWIFKILFLPGMSLEEILETYPGMMSQCMVLALLTAIVFAVLDHSLGSFRRLKKSQLTARQMMTQQLNLRFETLRNQISPHFLFNSLNTISSLIYRDASLAEKFIRNLAGVYHLVMEHYEQPLISLGRELELVEHYSYLMQVRFEQAFYLDIESPADPDIYLVPPLSIQMLVENAIKHNRLSQEIPLRIRICAVNDSLQVKNNYIGNPGYVRIGNDLYRKPDNGRPQGMGLKNIQNRYRLLTDRPVAISKDVDFTVILPLIRANETADIHN